MSIETLLQSVVDALKENTAALGGKASTKTTAEKTTADKKTTAAKTTATDSDGPDYEKDVKPLLIKTSQVAGREALLEIFAKYDVTKGDQLEAESYPAVMKKCKAVIAAKEAEEV